ncbi:uncharacterized protein [Mytilus edulis]|uniref:uncharacterized protein n=1 Tax=Mytilus edulis TaxID=6550 RepID=UPI0039EECB73
MSIGRDIDLGILYKPSKKSYSAGQIRRKMRGIIFINCNIRNTDKSATENGSTATKKSNETATQSQPDKSAAENDITDTKRSSETATASQTDLRVFQIDSWKEEKTHVYVTSAMKHVSDLLTYKTCVTVIGPPASGKSTIIRHVALQLQEKGYQLIPISSKTCFELYLLKSSDSNVRRIFVIDDFCGVDNVDVVAVDAWRSIYDSMSVLNENGGNGTVKMLIACRDCIYNSNQFQCLSFMTRHVYNMNEIPATVDEKCNMLEKYITRDNVAKVHPLLKDCNEYFPLFCNIAKRIRHINKIEDLFKLQKKYIEKDICDMSDEEFISVSACVLFSEFKDDWIQKETRPQHVDNAIRHLQRSILSSKESTLPKFSIQTGTYVKKNQNEYTLVHRVIHDIVFVKCNERAKDIFLQFASSSFIATRYIFQSIKQDSEDHEIKISNKKEYFHRLKRDLQNRELDSTFHNKQLQYNKYRKQLLHYINSNVDMNKILKNLQTERNLLIETAMEGYNDIIEMIISVRGNGDVNAQDIRGRTALHIAAEKGYTHVAESLLKHGAKIIKDKQNRSPVDYAQNSGKYDLVKILLDTS